MSNTLTITTAQSSLEIQAGGVGEISFSVSNTTAESLKVKAECKVKDGDIPEWIKLDSEGEFLLGAEETKVLKVECRPPADSPNTDLSLHLLSMTLRDPNEEYAESPDINVLVKKKEQNKKPIPWLFIGILAAILLIGGGVAFWLTRGGSDPAIELNLSKTELASNDKIEIVINNSGDTSLNFDSNESKVTIVDDKGREIFKAKKKDLTLSLEPGKSFNVRTKVRNSHSSKKTYTVKVRALDEKGVLVTTEQEIEVSGTLNVSFEAKLSNTKYIVGKPVNMTIHNKGTSPTLFSIKTKNVNNGRQSPEHFYGLFNPGQTKEIDIRSLVNSGVGNYQVRVIGKIVQTTRMDSKTLNLTIYKAPVPTRKLSIQMKLTFLNTFNQSIDVTYGGVRRRLNFGTSSGGSKSHSINSIPSNVPITLKWRSGSKTEATKIIPAGTGNVGVDAWFTNSNPLTRGRYIFRVRP